MPKKAASRPPAASLPMDDGYGIQTLKAPALEGMALK